MHVTVEWHSSENLHKYKEWKIKLYMHDKNKTKFASYVERATLSENNTGFVAKIEDFPKSVTQIERLSEQIGC